MYNSGHWDMLLPEFNDISYNAMLFSFRSLRLGKWYSAQFCEKINKKI